MNIQESLKNLITKHKSNPNYDTIVNDLCRLYFEVENESKSIIKDSSIGDCLKELENDLITEQNLFSLGFNKQFGIENQYLYDSSKIRISLKMKNNIIYILNIDFKHLDYNDFLIENLEIKSIKEFQTILIILSKIEL